MAYILGFFKLTVIAFLSVTLYIAFSGGVHAKTHIACIISTNLFYIGNVFLSKWLVYDNEIIKYILIVGVWIFSMIMIKLYAPADTENLPILRKKERKAKKILSYISMTATLIIAAFVKDSVISNIMILGTLFQTILITRFVYKITNNKYGHEVYEQENLLN